MNKQIETSSQNSTTQFGATTHTTNNREEIKMKMLLTGSYDYIHRETGKMIQKKLYKKAFGLLERFHQSRKDLQMAEVIQLNRRVISCINKILKIQLTKPELEQESEEVLVNMIRRGTQALSQIYKYLNIYIQKVLPSEANFVILEDVSHLSDSSLDEKTYHIKSQKTKTVTQMINQYPKIKNLTKKDLNETESDRIAEMIQRSEKLLNIEFELEDMWYNTCELLLKAGLIYKKKSKLKLVYYYLYEANRISENIDRSSNPALINLCARIKITFANYLFEIDSYEKAEKLIDEALVLLSGEMRIRMNGEKYVTKYQVNREKRKIKRCAKTVLSAMMTLVAIQESKGQFHEMIETLVTVSWFAEKYVQGIDEFKKYVMKTSTEIKNQLETFLRDVSDLSFIAEQALEQELYDLKRRLKEKKITQEEQNLIQFHEEMYKLFQFKDLNQNQYIINKNNNQQQLRYQQSIQVNNLQSEVSSPKQIHKTKDESPQNQGTDISRNILESNQSEEESFFDASFFAPSENNFVFDSVSEQSRNKELQPELKPKVMRELKSVGLIKIGAERAIDHKSKILTTNQYFKQFQAQTKSTEVLKKENISVYKKILENMDLRQYPERMAQTKQDQDIYVKRMVEERIGTGGIEEYERMQPQLQMQLKQEEFDRKEFVFSRKMLLLQKKEALRQGKYQVSKKQPIRIEIDTKVNNEGMIVESKIELEKELKELKKRKIDKMVADKKLKAQEGMSLQLKDPEETNYLKKVLEKSKKKKLKDLLQKHQVALGLRKFFGQLQKEQREQEKVLRLLKSGLIRQGDVRKNKTVRISVDELGTEQEQKRQRIEVIEKYQKKAHNVISLVVDGVEKKIDSERKMLKKLVFKQKGGRRRYVDEDEKTQLKFTKSYLDLGRSTHLMKIKRELQEKTYTFDEMVMMRYQINKKNIQDQELINNIQN